MNVKKNAKLVVLLIFCSQSVAIVSSDLHPRKKMSGKTAGIHRIVRDQGLDDFVTEVEVGHPYADKINKQTATLARYVQDSSLNPEKVELVKDILDSLPHHDHKYKADCLTSCVEFFCSVLCCVNTHDGAIYGMDCQEQRQAVNEALDRNYAMRKIAKSEINKKHKKR